MSEERENEDAMRRTARVNPNWPRHQKYTALLAQEIETLRGQVRALLDDNAALRKRDAERGVLVADLDEANGVMRDRLRHCANCHKCTLRTPHECLAGTQKGKGKDDHYGGHDSTGSRAIGRGQDPRHA